MSWLALCIWMIVAIVGAHMAGGKGRRRPLWFALCFCFGLCALCVLACLSPVSA
jgi:hypothetical protein